MCVSASTSASETACSLASRAQGVGFDCANIVHPGMNRLLERAVNSPSGPGENDAEERYGVADYRSIRSWVFAARVLLRPKRRARMSIGTLHVKVVEARGLLARDGMLGRSDPYVNLDLSGRYLSSGQEWSEEFRIQEQTGVVRFSLNPVWNESFSLPVRRAGAFLRVELWDWDYGVSDDPLGSVEVKIGEELLSQKAMDMWFVLDAPSDWKKKPSAPILSRVKATRKKEQQQPSEVEEELIEEEEAVEELDATPAMPVLAPGWGSALGKRYKRKSTSKSGGTVDAPEHHGHSAGKESETCEACIQRRRDQFGEVRLELRFEFNEFGETCSHMWPEEPPKPVETTFSPNRVFYNALLLNQLARPYVSCLQGASATVHWVRPWRSLSWFVALVVMLLRPCLLIVVINASLAWSVISAYLEFTYPEERTYSSDASSSAAVARGRRRISRRFTKAVPKKSLLPQIDEPGDEKLQEMYRTVRRTKKLPVVVEEIGRRTFETEALPAQRQVETMGRVLMTARRRLRPVRATSLVFTVVALSVHMALQLWLYRTSRFHLYLVGCCCLVFAYNFYAWRGRAFVAGVREAVRCRQLRTSLDYTGFNTAPTAGSQNGPFEGGPGPGFAPPGATTVAIGDQSTFSMDDDDDGDPFERDLDRSNDAAFASATVARAAAAPEKGPNSGFSSGSSHSKSRSPSPSGVPKRGEARETFAEPAKKHRKSVRFQEGPAPGGDGGPLLLPLVGSGANNLASLAVDRARRGRDLWKHGKERSRTWKGSSSSGRPSYGSIEDDASDVEGGAAGDEETGGVGGGQQAEVTGASSTSTPRQSFLGGKSGDSGTSGGGSRGTQRDGLLAQSSEGGDSPVGGAHGWRGRVSKWYHDF